MLVCQIDCQSFTDSQSFIVLNTEMLNKKCYNTEKNYIYTFIELKFLSKKLLTFLPAGKTQLMEHDTP